MLTSRRPSIRLTFLMLVAALGLAACGTTTPEASSTPDQASSSPSATAQASEAPKDADAEKDGDKGGDTASEKPAESGAKDGKLSANCTADKLLTQTKGKLTIATGDVVYEPWMVDDDPTNGKGFESAVAYAVADKLGYAKGDVTWVRTTFDGAIAPGAKDWDFNIQQYSITDERKEVVDFSEPYYTVQQALVAVPGSKVTGATTLADLQDAKLGAAIGTTSLAYIEDTIKPKAVPQVYDDNAAGKAAIDAKLVDGLVFDVPTAFYITGVEIPEAKIVGTLPVDGKAETLGLLVPKGSSITSCLDEAVVALREGGELQTLQDKWLNQEGSIAQISK